MRTEMEARQVWGVAFEKDHWKQGSWKGRNMLHEERPGVAEGIEDSELKLGCGNAQELE